jgi:Acyl-protein synthetase, LuxE
VAENQPTNKHRMNKDLSSFAARLRRLISYESSAISGPQFNELALELFGLQFAHNAAYRKICEARKLTPEQVEHWTQIPFVPTGAFKELELTSLASEEWTAVFHSSGTTEQRPSRHYHSAESLELYKVSLWKWFAECGVRNAECGVQKMICLTPQPELAPHSSLVHMFETVRHALEATESVFVGKLDVDGAWALDFDLLLDALDPRPQIQDAKPHLLLGTAFSFVHLVDFLAEKNLRFQLPLGSRVMETGGYKNRSRTMPKGELHGLITEYLGVPAENIICEYGMSELSSQAYDTFLMNSPLPERRRSSAALPIPKWERRFFQFPSWTRVQIVSPETGREVAEGETGLIRIIDLANVFSVAAIQTEDLGIRRGDGFEVVGRAKLAEPRGCSLMTA